MSNVILDVTVLIIYISVTVMCKGASFLCNELLCIKNEECVTKQSKQFIVFYSCTHSKLTLVHKIAIQQNKGLGSMYSEIFLLVCLLILNRWKAQTHSKQQFIIHLCACAVARNGQISK